MRIFITGATGYIGTAVTSALIHAGHEITALARPTSESGALERAGVKILRGELTELGNFAEVVEAHDVAIHTAADRSDPAAADRAVLDALLPIAGLRIVYTSGVWVFGNTGDAVVDESSPVQPISIVQWRPDHEERVLEEANDRSAVIRPGCVYGGRQSLLAGWFAAAANNEPLDLIGHGVNRWSMVYLDDLADLYLKVVEEEASGLFHATDDSRATLGQMAKAIIEGAGGSSSVIRYRPLDEVEKELGPFSEALALDQHVSSALTRSSLHWEPSVSFVHSIERQWEEWRQAT